MLSLLFLTLIYTISVTSVELKQRGYGGSRIDGRESEISSHLLDRPILINTNSSSSSSKSNKISIDSVDSDGNCYFPPFCKLDTNICNIPKISYKTIESNPNIFYSNYVSLNQPVIIQFCDKKDKEFEKEEDNEDDNEEDNENPCDLSMIINNKTGLFTWENIISRVRSNQDYIDYLNLEKNGTMRERSQTCDIHPLRDQRYKYDNGLNYSLIIDNIKVPSWLDENFDIFDNLIGYLNNIDDEMMGNKWTIFGTTGGGAHYHFDYYLTSFWNIVLEGSKYWILTEPFDTLKIFDNNDTFLKQVVNLPIYDFFNEWIVNKQMQNKIDRLNLENVHSNGNGNKNDKKIKLYQCKQEIGDMLYAPSIFYHSTVNLEKTLSVSRNLITKYNYLKVFNFITQMISLRSKSIEDKDNNNNNKYVGIYQTIQLCCALYHYDKTLFGNSQCWTKEFLNNLNQMPPLYFDQTLSINSNNSQFDLRNKFRYHAKYNSQFYINMCNYAKDHSTLSTFWA